MSPPKVHIFILNNHDGKLQGLNHVYLNEAYFIIMGCLIK